MSIEIKMDNRSVYDPPPAVRQFGIGREVEDKLIYKFICTCRETFLNSIKGNLTNQWVVYYAQSNKIANNIKRFIEDCERRLIKDKYQRSQIHAVGRKVCILPAEFWKIKFRLGLLTILIRAGKKYQNKIKFSKCLYSCSYIKSKGMKAAVRAFFSGKTAYKEIVGDYNYPHARDGLWLDEFEELTAKESVSRLQKQK